MNIQLTFGFPEKNYFTDTLEELMEAYNFFGFSFSIPLSVFGEKQIPAESIKCPSGRVMDKNQLLTSLGKLEIGNKDQLESLRALEYLDNDTKLFQKRV